MVFYNRAIFLIFSTTVNILCIIYFLRSFLGRTRIKNVARSALRKATESGSAKKECGFAALIQSDLHILG